MFARDRGNEYMNNRRYSVIRVSPKTQLECSSNLKRRDVEYFSESFDNDLGSTREKFRNVYFSSSDLLYFFKKSLKKKN